MDWTMEEQKLIYSAVRRATSGFTFMPRGYERDDLLQEGAIAWFMARDGWSEERGKLSTFLYNVVSRHIRGIIRKGDAEKRASDKYAIKYLDGITPYAEVGEWF